MSKIKPEHSGAKMTAVTGVHAKRPSACRRRRGGVRIMRLPESCLGKQLINRRKKKVGQTNIWPIRPVRCGFSDYAGQVCHYCSNALAS